LAPIQQPLEAEFSGVNGIVTPAQTIYLENLGAATLTGIVIVDADLVHFPEVGNSCGPTLAAGAKCAVTIVYNPPVYQFAESFQSHVSFSFTGAGLPQVVQLYAGSEPPSPQAQVTIAGLIAPSNITMENSADQPPTAQQLTIKSTGNVPLKLYNIVIYQSKVNGKLLFSLDLSPGCKAGSLLPVGASCTFNLLFKAYEYGTYSAGLEINTNDISNVPLEIGITGLGYNAPKP
jgi:hypothetical protein